MEEKIYHIKKTGKKQLCRIAVYLCCLCGKECKIEKKRLDKPPFTGRCKKCISRRKPFESLYKDFIWKSKKRNLSNDISYDQFLTFTSKSNCFYCDDLIPWQMYGVQFAQSRGYFLDRKDNDKGYSLDNCVVCCKNCNFTRANRYTFEEFCLFIPVLKQISKNRESIRSRIPKSEFDIGE